MNSPFGKSRRIVQVALLMVAAIVPQVVWACPACALRDDGGIAASLILAAMMILPFGLVGLVVYALRKATREEENQILAGNYDSAGGEQRA